MKDSFILNTMGTARRLRLAVLHVCMGLFLVSCGSDGDSPVSSTRPEKPEMGFSLLVGNINNDLTIRLTATKDGASVASVDSFTYYAENHFFDSGVVPFSHSESHAIEFGDYTFEFFVYDGVVTSGTVSSAVLLGSASQTYSVNNNFETVPAMTILVGEGEAYEDTLSFFPASPSFTDYTVYDPSTSSTQTAGKYSSIDLDSDGVAHISFLFEDTSSSPYKRLAYTYGNDSSWATPWILEEYTIASSAIYSDVGEFTSLAVDSEDGVHISYYDSTYQGSSSTKQGYDLRYIYVAPDDVSFGSSEKASSGDAGNPSGQYGSLALHESIIEGKRVVYPYISSYRNVGSTARTVLFSTNDTGDGSWKTALVNGAGGSHGKYSSITVDSSGVAHMAYMGSFDKTPSILRYSSCISYVGSTTAASCTTSVTGIAMLDGVEQTTSIDVDPDGIVHILYYNYSTKSLHHVYGTKSTSWTSEVVDNTSSTDVGQYADMKVSADGIVHVAYYDGINKDLLYKQKDPVSGWSSAVTVDGASADVGQHVSMSLDQAFGIIHLSYYDETNQNLKYSVSN